MSERTERVAKSIIEELSRMLEQGEIKDPRIGFVTLTGADVSPDMRHAKVYFSSLGNSKAKARALEGLLSARGFIRTALGKTLRLKYVPEVTFVFDASVEAGARITKLINEIHAKEKPRTEDEE